MSRDTTIDIARGIGIVLVVAGHTMFSWKHNLEVHKFIYAFHMPLFFAISGAFVSRDKSFKAFAVSKFKRLIIPFYLWVTFVLIFKTSKNLAKLLLAGHIDINSSPTFVKLSEIIRLFLFANKDALVKAQIYDYFWFLPAVFMLTMFLRLIPNYKKKENVALLVFGLILMSYVTVTINNQMSLHNHVPWSIDIAIVCLPFAFVIYLRDYIYKINRFIIIGFVLAIYYISTLYRFNISSMRIENYIVFLLSGAIGIMLVLRVSSLINNMAIGRMLAKVGCRSFEIYIWHGVIATIWRPIATRITVLEKRQLVISFASFLLGISIPYFLRFRTSKKKI